MKARARKLAGAAPPVRYRIRPADPQAHLFEVEVEVRTPDRQGQRFALPAWIPGSYMIREFARHLRRPAASSAGRRVGLRKLDKHTWQARPCVGTLTLRYTVYAWDLSVRGAHLDETHGFFNGTSVFVRALGLEDQACEVEIEAPATERCQGWQVATTLPRAGARPRGFGAYRAANYDELIDHPVELGTFSLVRFSACGIPHEVAITGRHDTDARRLAADLAAICEAQIRLFEPRTRRAPFDRYVFLTMAVNEGHYGGLEHRASTALVCNRNDLPWPGMQGVPDGYRVFLGLASHEYFHSWHVKRIKPAVFARYALDQEQYTRLLWVFEGFTSYYDDLMLLRAGIIDADQYLRTLAGTISQVLRNPGRLAQSVAESSFDAWIKYYRQDESSPNAIVSYYAKGALVALCLDLTIRSDTGGKRSLDDVMRVLWQRFGRDFERDRQGLGEDGLPAVVEAATGLNLRREIQAWTEGTGELPLARLLAEAGVHLALKEADDRAGWLGARLQTRNGDLVIGTALGDGPVQRAGLSAGDVIVAADGLRVTERALKTMLARRAPGARLRVHAFRRDELLEREVVLGKAPATEAELGRLPAATATARSIGADWLSTMKRVNPRR